MTDCIAYLNDCAADAEVCEWLQHQGCEPRIVHSRNDLLRLLQGHRYARVIFELKRLSDVPILQALRDDYRQHELVLIASAEMKLIIDVLRHSTYPIVESLTDLFNSNSDIQTRLEG